MGKDVLDICGEESLKRKTNYYDLLFVNLNFTIKKPQIFFRSCRDWFSSPHASLTDKKEARIKRASLA